MVIKDIQAKVYPCIDINISKMEDVEKFISLDIGDIVRVLYNDDTTEKEIEGKLVNIATKPPVPGYKLSKNEYIITVDSSNNYESKQYSIDVSTIRDINIVNKNEEADNDGTITGEQLQNAISKYFEDHKDEFKGEPGESGVAPNITIGEVTTLLPGSDATANFTKDEDGTLKLNLGIPKGADGNGNGEPGSGEIVAPNITIGEVVTLTAGSDATASFTEDEDGTLKLNLGIPRGDKGEPGEPGSNSESVTPNIAIGEVVTLEAGSGATASFTEDMDGTLKLNLGIPKGANGENGEPGENGIAPNIAIGEVTTLEAGSNATASFTEDENGTLKLNLGIPRGADGNGNGSSSPELTVPDSTDTDAKYDIYVSGGKLKLFKHDFTVPKSFNDQTAAATMLAMEPGINIGNSLDSYDTNKGFSEDGFLNQETRWMNPEITQEFVQKIKSLGFRSVRIPVTWYHNTYINENGERKVGKYFKARVREVVDWALDAGLYVVINAHFDAAKGFLFKIGETEEDFATILKDVEDVWSDIADKFKMYGEKLVFESFNEISTSNPAYGNIVTDEKNNQFTLLNQKFVDTVRATGYNNANRVLILQSMYTKQWHDAAKRFVVPTDTATNKLAYCMHPYTQLIGEQNQDFFRKLAACKSIIGLPMSFNEWGTVKKGMPTDTWRVKQAQDFVVRCFYISTNSQWWDNGSESDFKLLDRTGTEDKRDMINGLLASKSGNKPTWYIRPSKIHTLTGDVVQKGTWQADGTLSYKPTWGSISSPMYDIEGNKYAQYSCITMNEADEKIVVMAHIKYFDADGNLLPTTGSNAALSFPTLERLDTIPENAVKCCYTIYSKHNHLTYEQYRELINNKDLVCRVALFNGEEDMEQVTGDATTMNLRYTYWYANNKYNEVNGSIALVEDTNTTALQTPRRCLGNTKYNITVADYVDTNNLSIEILESNCDNIILQRHTLTSGTASIITNENTSKLYFNIIGDSDFATNLGELYGKVSPISSFSDRTCTAFTVNSTDITLTILGQQFEISISNKTPSDSIVTPRYAISNDNIVSITGNTITALKKGTATIFVYVGDAYQKINVTVDTSSSIIPIEYTDSINYFTADGVWQTSSGESGVKGIRVEPNATYSITRNGSYSAWCAAESNELASGIALSNVTELDSTKTEIEYTTSSTAKYLLVSGANSKMKTLDIEKISGGNTGTGSNEENTGSGSDEGGTSEGDNTGSDNVDGP